MSAIEPTSATAADTWFEDFRPGQRIRHARAATIDAVTGAFLAKRVMNTAQVHWNNQAGRDGVLGPGFVVFGLITASTVLGLAGQDTTENAECETSYDDFRFTAPVYQGDTVSAFSEVISVQPHPERNDVGVVQFAHWGVNQDDTVVFHGKRTALVRKRVSCADS
ncbi:MaoC family dehydratase [uncultured Jatrophihabitans sp.]|uniref:MaoC family dehydratase n=1 Tax=uncultured Jatrophihabitans sp. TaxID=1610747 RepID=UPI0035C9C7B9